MENLTNKYQGAIDELVNQGHVILQVFAEDGSCYFFSVFDFQESFTSPTNSVEFNSVRGINITDFMRTQGANPNVVELTNRFNHYLNTAKVVRCEFSRNWRWMKWGSAER